MNRFIILLALILLASCGGSSKNSPPATGISIKPPERIAISPTIIYRNSTPKTVIEYVTPIINISATNTIIAKGMSNTVFFNVSSTSSVTSDNNNVRVFISNLILPREYIPPTLVYRDSPTPPPRVVYLTQLVPSYIDRNVFIYSKSTPTTVYVTNTITVTDTVYVTNTITVTDTVYVTNTITVTDTVYVTNTITVTDTVYVTNTITVTDTVYVTNTITVTDTVYVTNTITVTDTVYITLTETVKVNFWRLAENGITIFCEGAEINETGRINGKTYTKRSKDQITVDNAHTTCTSGITDMSYLFSVGDGLSGTTSFNGDISHWDTRAVTNMYDMFREAQSFNQDISNWHTGSVTNTQGMFRQAKEFNQDIGNWDTSSFVHTTYMFDSAAAFNQSLSRWDTSNITDMYRMFNFGGFKQDISNWCVENIVERPILFSSFTSMQQEPDWGADCK